MSLASRRTRFREMASRFECRLASPLIAEHRLRPDLLERLRIAAALYLVSCLPDRTAVSAALLADERALLAEVERQWGAMPNITPNGMVVPKRELNLEYNLFVGAFAAVMDSLGIDDFVDSWLNPPNLRVKESVPTADKLIRPYASEQRHTEAWIEMNTAGAVSVFIPLLGDTERNRVRFFTPGGDFDEAWLRPLESYDRGRAIADRYSPAEVGYDKGCLYLADVATMHQSERQPGCGPRVSIDVNFLLRKPGAAAAVSSVERPTPADLSATGQTRLFVFMDSMRDQIDTLGGKRHPTARRRLVHLGVAPAPAVSATYRRPAMGTTATRGPSMAKTVRSISGSK